MITYVSTPLLTDFPNPLHLDEDCMQWRLEKASRMKNCGLRSMRFLQQFFALWAEATIFPDRNAVS
ncbi:hypothetical protein ABVF61_15905 [Roseibium sp. HPY-6]|uniref:hypothetical protein n=1 Tax=Roseibium sp. HPY-6 TaxID=3229852 RepID=UPI00338F9BED